MQVSSEKKVEVRTRGYTFEEEGNPYKGGRDGVLNPSGGFALHKRR